MNTQTDSQESIERSEFAEQLDELIKLNDFESVHVLIESVPVDDRPLYLSRLNPEVQQQLLVEFNAEQAADFLHNLPEVQAVELLDQIPAESAADILEELPKDEQADLVGELSGASAEAILAEMDDASAAQIVRSLSEYEDDQAGGIMIAEFLSFTKTETVDSVINHLRENSEEYSDFNVQYAYVVDDEQRLIGVLRLRDLLLSRPATRVGSLMIANPLSVHHFASVRELHELFEEHAFLGVPVVDDDGRLVGVVRRGDVEEALAEQNADDYLKSQGIISEELRTMPLAVRSRRRLAWLSINILLNIVAASVIAFYQDTLTKVIALAVFLPIISDMSGCSGNQAVAVSMRELSLGLVQAKEVFRVWLKEVSVGLINGFVLGLLIAGVAFAWQGNPWLGAVVGVAMMVNTVIAVSLGGTLPLIMRRLNMDPALASGPILTTVTDMCGFFLVLSLASLFINRLV